MADVRVDISVTFSESCYALKELDLALVHLPAWAANCIGEKIVELANADELLSQRTIDGGVELSPSEKLMALIAQVRALNTDLEALYVAHAELLGEAPGPEAPGA